MFNQVLTYLLTYLLAAKELSKLIYRFKIGIRSLNILRKNINIPQKQTYNHW